MHNTTSIAAFRSRADSLTHSRVATRIATDIALDTIAHDVCTVTHKEFGRRTGAGRRTVDNALKSIQALGLVERVGRTDEGRSIYKALWATAE